MLSYKPHQMSSTAQCSRHTAVPSPRAPVSLGSRQVVQQHHLCSGQAAAAAQQQQRALVQRPRAVKDEEAELDRITKEAGQSDIWSNEVAGNAVKVFLVAGVVTFVLLISNLAKPMYDNTIRSFPTPAEYELYEQRDNDGGF